MGSLPCRGSEGSGTIGWALSFFGLARHSVGTSLCVLNIAITIDEDAGKQNEAMIEQRSTLPSVLNIAAVISRVGMWSGLLIEPGGCLQHHIILAHVLTPE